jgi:hypothetical protein
MGLVRYWVDQREEHRRPPRPLDRDAAPFGRAAVVDAS